VEEMENSQQMSTILALSSIFSTASCSDPKVALLHETSSLAVPPPTTTAKNKDYIDKEGCKKKFRKVEERISIITKGL